VAADGHGERRSEFAARGAIAAIRASNALSVVIGTP